MGQDENDDPLSEGSETRQIGGETEKLKGVFGDELDVFGMVGLGLGATPEARKYVLLGILYEWQKDIEKNLGKV